MQAETVYNVYMALPEEERLRLYKMVDADVKLLQPVEVKKDDGQYTDAECTDALMKILEKQKSERFGKKKLMVVK
ncbi:hypothetical protein GR160_03010 [Flavobacterium sp. Sd200]|uniref:hypothetical protein n=1 Tax=Flavobacterium sp. Sd200 TaxID=2692211 RepID=UPI00136C1971|nr:hypothetical protein [Flavobacterium sp. Sd200]MXN90184.1 hypothetical protein [Flavobacterium sp. Sd200]